jgi:hypothetical protein
MARRRRTYPRTRTVYRKARRAYRSRKSFLGGSMKHIVWGAGAGVASNFIPQFFGKWTNPVVFGGAGILLKKPDLVTVAGYELGKGLLGSIGAGTGAGGGSFWEG